MSKIGYIRVSTEHQETARHQEIMGDYQVDRIFSEKISGANADRPQLRAMLDYVREGIEIAKAQGNVHRTNKVRATESLSPPTGQDSVSFMRNGSQKASQAGTLCGEWLA